MGSKVNSVIVLMPNGRRQTLKINLDDSVLQILEEVCAKHGFNFEEFSLRHHHTILDPTSVLRYSGLPNNAFLEMVPNHRPSVVGGKVMLSLQVEGSIERLTGEFSSESSLELVLSKLSPDVINTSSNKVPVIVYMRKEIIGIDAFRTTTLRNLGLTSGRALLRVTTRDTEEHPDLKFTGVSVLTARKEDKPEEDKTRNTASTSSTDSKNKPVYLSNKRPTFESQTIPAAEIVTAVELVHDVLSEARLNEDMFSNQQPSDSRSKEEMPSCSGRNQNKKSPSFPRKLEQTVPKEVDKTTKPKVDIMDINLDEVNFLKERRGLIFTLENSSMSFSHELPDSFFDVTLDDVKVMMKHLTKSRKEMENAPLQTEALRKLDHEKRLNHYKNTVIRIQFPDRLVLQGVFNSDESVNDVIKFVRNYIREPKVDFYLYTSPPKTVLNGNDSLVSVGCVPCGKMYFSFADQSVVAEKFLNDNVLPFMTSHAIATYVACQLRVMDNQMKTTEHEEIINVIDSQQPQSVAAPVYMSSLDTIPRRAGESSSIPPDRTSVPKWFKP